MNPVTLIFGSLLVLAGFVMFIRRLHDRSVHDSLVMLRSRGGLPPAIAGFVNLLAPVVASIGSGIAFVAVGLVGTSWIGW